jgi:hypothetical protein
MVSLRSNHFFLCKSVENIPNLLVAGRFTINRLERSRWREERPAKSPLFPNGYTAAETLAPCLGRHAAALRGKNMHGPLNRDVSAGFAPIRSMTDASCR